jgi:hydroxyacylglutathione hydrolase
VGIRVRGYLSGGMTAWRSEGRRVSRLPMIDPGDLAERIGTNGPVVLDVRDDGEWRDGHIPGSVHIPYQELSERLGELPRDREIATLCSGGKRSGLAASILQREGFERIVHVGGGGIPTWRREGHPLEAD